MGLRDGCGLAGCAPDHGPDDRHQAGQLRQLGHRRGRAGGISGGVADLELDPAAGGALGAEQPECETDTAQCLPPERGIRPAQGKHRSEDGARARGIEPERGERCTGRWHSVEARAPTHQELHLADRGGTGRRERQAVRQGQLVTGVLHPSLLGGDPRQARAHARGRNPDPELCHHRFERCGVDPRDGRVDLGIHGARSFGRGLVGADLPEPAQLRGRRRPPDCQIRQQPVCGAPLTGVEQRETQLARHLCGLRLLTVLQEQPGER